MPRKDQLSLLNKLLDKKNYQNQGSLQGIIQELFMPVEEINASSSFHRKGVGVAKVIGIVSAISRLILFGGIAYRAGASISDDDSIGLGIAAAALVVTSTGYITYNVLTNMSKRTYESAISFFQCKRVPTLATTLHPYLTIIRNVPETIFSTLTLIPLLDLPKEYLPFPNQVNLVIQIGFAIGTFLLYTNAMNDLTDQLLTQPVWTDEEGQMLIKLYRGLNRLENTIRNSSLLNIALFLNIFPNEVFEETNKSLNLSKESLKKYLNKNEVDLEMLESTPLITQQI